MNNFCSIFGRKTNQEMNTACGEEVKKASVTKAEGMLCQFLIKNQENPDKKQLFIDVQNLKKIMALPTEAVSVDDLHPLLKVAMDNAIKMR